MSKPSSRPNREAIKEQRKLKKKQEKELRARQIKEGLQPKSTATLPNTCSTYATVEEEREARTQATTGQLAVLRQQLPHLLRRLSKIPDPRDPKRTKHQMTVLLIYGLLMFVFQFASRREVNREMGLACFKENLLILTDSVGT